MAIYIPGWYEQMAKSGSIQKLGNVLGDKFAPDYRANARLQEMVQQNPMLMEQFSNMDDATRAQLSKSLGFVNKDPIKGLPVGAQRQERERNQGFMNDVMKDPEALAEVKARVTGTLTPTQRKKDALDIRQGEQAVAQNELMNEINTFKVKDIKKTSSMIDEAMQQFPDLSKIDYKAMVRDFVRQGKPLNSMLMLATDQNPGAKMVLDLGIKVELQKLEAEQRASLARAKDPNTKLMYLNTLKELGTQLNRSEDNLLQEKASLLKPLETNMAYMLERDPAKKAAMEASVLGDVGRRLTQVQSDIRDNMEKATFFSNQIAGQEGVKLPDKTETAEERKARLRKIAGGV